MELAHESLAKGFGYRGPDEINPDLIPGTAGKQRVFALAAPEIMYFYRGEGKYFSFGTTEPEGAVIPREMFEPGSPFLDSVTAWIDPSPPEIAIGDRVRVEWVALDGSASFQSPPQEVVSKDRFLMVAIPDNQIVKFEGKNTEVIFFHLPQAGGAIPSPSRRVYVAPALGHKPELEVEGVVDGVLDTTAYPDGIEVRIAPIENMRNYNAIEVLWMQPFDHWVDRQRLMTVTPDQDMVFTVKPEVYKRYIGKHVSVKYFIYLGAKLSPNFFWSVGSADVSFKLI